MNARFQSFKACLLGRSNYNRGRYNISNRFLRVLFFPCTYMFGVLFSVLDILQVGTLLNSFLIHTNRNKRRLTERELSYFKGLSADQEYLKKVWIVENSWISKLGATLIRRPILGLGICKSVHFSRKLSTDNQFDLGWLIHEIAHTLQYKYRGIIYIPEALIAQRLSGYNFGGMPTLKDQIPLKWFNPEQQAEILRVVLLTKTNSSLRQEIEKGNW